MVHLKGFVLQNTLTCFNMMLSAMKAVEDGEKVSTAARSLSCLVTDQ